MRNVYGSSWIRLVLCITAVIFSFLLIGCPNPVGADPTNEIPNGENGGGNGEPPPGTYSAPVIRGRILDDGSRSLVGRNIPDQVWVVPVYHRIGGFETGISFMTLQYTEIINLADDGSFAFAYADEDAPEGIPVIDEFLPEYSHAAYDNPNDRSVFSGTVTLVLVNSHKAVSEKLEDRKEALIGYIALPTADEAATLISLPIAEIKEEEEGVEIDLGEISDSGDTREARAEATVEDVHEYLKLELDTLMALASTDGVLKTIGNFVVNNMLEMAGLGPEDDDYFHWGVGIGHTWLYPKALDIQVSGYREDPDDPEIHTGALQVWDPSDAFSKEIQEYYVYTDSGDSHEDARNYLGYQVHISGSDNLGDLTITPPDGVHRPEEGYIAPYEGFKIHEGWWSVTSGSGDRSAAFQMDAAQIFDNDRNLRVLVPKIEFRVEEADASFKLWRPRQLLDSASDAVGTYVEDLLENQSGKVGVDAFVLIDDEDEIGKNHFSLQQLKNLTISWYLYDHEEEEYVKADDEFVKLALGYVGVSIAGPSGGGEYYQGDHIYTVKDNGSRSLDPIYDTLPIADGYDDWREYISWKEFQAIDDLADGTFFWDLTEDDAFKLFFDPEFHDAEDFAERIFQVNNRDHQSYYVVTGEGDDRVFWKGLPAEWTPVRAIHVHYFMHGIGMRFSFGKDM